MPKRWVSNYLTWVQLKTHPLPKPEILGRSHLMCEVARFVYFNLVLSGVFEYVIG